ncbi:hypothetical protein VNO77_28843 [Canavalia gladiata]|uniref:Uncharacterized protein n=1 Tax=Canavalia gladiata TaxID=3824 RepID=A0AAN9L0R3_CANGL
MAKENMEEERHFNGYFRDIELVTSENVIEMAEVTLDMYGSLTKAFNTIIQQLGKVYDEEKTVRNLCMHVW